MKQKTKWRKMTAALLSLVLTESGLVMGNGVTVSASQAFDESNIVLRFGVLSDIHLSGSWNVGPSSQKLDRAYTALQLMAGENTLDAVFIDGDITDAMNSSGNMSGSMQKLRQNYVEIGRKIQRKPCRISPSAWLFCAFYKPSKSEY